jgi:hypothetical protein
MLMKILFTFGSARRISKAFFTVSGVAPLKNVKQLDCYEYRMESIPSNVQEVGRLSAVERKNVHSRHGQTRPVHQTPDTAVKLNKVKVSFLGFNLGGFLL